MNVTRAVTSLAICAAWSLVAAGCGSPQPEVLERKVETGSGSLFVRAGGVGPDVVLLHGLGDSSAGWRRIEQPLRAAGFRVTVWDALGAGRSGRPDPGDHGLAAHVDRLCAVLDALDIERASLVGNSLGGTLALLCAQFHPERVDGLVLINPAAYPEGGTTPDWFWKVPGLAENTLGRLPPRLVAPFVLHFLSGDPRRLRDEDLRAEEEAAARDGALKGVLLQERQLLPDARTLARWVVGMRDIRAPVLILWGDQDPILSMDQPHRLACDLQHAELHLLAGIGHAAQLEAPDRVLKETVAFLRRMK